MNGKKLAMRVRFDTRLALQRRRGQWCNWKYGGLYRYHRGLWAEWRTILGMQPVSPSYTLKQVRYRGFTYAE